VPEQEQSEILFGKIALSLEYVTSEQLTKCILIREKSNRRKSLGTIMLDEGYITKEQMDEILHIQRENLDTATRHPAEKLEDIIIARLAMKYGYATENNITDALRLQRVRESKGNFYRLGEILVEKGYASVKDVLALLSMRKKHLLICSTCGAKFNAAKFEPGRRYRCKRCKALLPVTPPVEPIDFGTTVFATE
jgi:hypothetical protein